MSTASVSSWLPRDAGPTRGHGVIPTTAGLAAHREAACPRHRARIAGCRACCGARARRGIGRRAPAGFATGRRFSRVSLADCSLPRHGKEVLRLIDATPIPLTSLHKWADWRMRGLKAHVVYDPDPDRPVRLEITAATVNDVLAGRRQPIEPGATYVFDKAYVDYTWWRSLHEAGCCFVTRPKSNVPLRRLALRPISERDRQEAGIQSDDIVELASQQRPRLPILLRRILLRREDGRLLTILSNDLERSARSLRSTANAGKIELLFRWIKQHLKVRSFLGLASRCASDGGARHWFLPVTERPGRARQAHALAHLVGRAGTTIEAPGADRLHRRGRPMPHRCKLGRRHRARIFPVSQAPSGSQPAAYASPSC
jgi:hypothetical protein